MAEDQGLYELAIRCYERLVPESPKLEVELLEKVHQNALHLRDTPRLLDVSRRLVHLRPLSGVFRDRLHYLNLLTGQEMEDCWKALASRNQEAMVEGQVRRLPTAFLEAFAAFRFHDDSTLRAALSRLSPQVSDLSPGQRAVVAALLQRTGQKDESTRLAETVNPLLLLPEEQMLLDWQRRP